MVRSFAETLCPPSISQEEGSCSTGRAWQKQQSGRSLFDPKKPIKHSQVHCAHWRAGVPRIWCVLRGRGLGKCAPPCGRTSTGMLGGSPTKTLLSLRSGEISFGALEEQRPLPHLLATSTDFASPAKVSVLRQSYFPGCGDWTFQRILIARDSGFLCNDDFMLGLLDSVGCSQGTSGVGRVGG